MKHPLNAKIALVIREKGSKHGDQAYLGAPTGQHQTDPMMRAFDDL